MSSLYRVSIFRQNKKHTRRHLICPQKSDPLHLHIQMRMECIRFEILLLVFFFFFFGLIGNEIKGFNDWIVRNLRDTFGKRKKKSSDKLSDDYVTHHISPRHRMCLFWLQTQMFPDKVKCLELSLWGSEVWHIMLFSYLYC